MRNIMFVCTGNTCRSPMAEYILKDLLKKAGINDVKVTSAGLMTDEGAVIAKEAREALKKLGITVRRFKCKKADGGLCRKQDAVICMTEAQKSRFLGFANIYSINELTSCGEIKDPFGKGPEEYEACALDIKRACEKLVKLLES